MTSDVTRHQYWQVTCVPTCHNTTASRDFEANFDDYSQDDEANVAACGDFLHALMVVSL